jgi:SAM-dependent methyltransferase
MSQPTADANRDDRLLNDRFPRSNRYHPDWVLEGASGGANALWLVEWLAEAMDLRPGMRVLDLGCGKSSTSIFLAQEFGVEVWATDLWTSAAEIAVRVRGAGCEGRIIPIHADARSLPFAPEFFDAVISVDAYVYFGTDDLYLNYLAGFVKPGGQIGVVGAGLTRELVTVPEHLRAWWSADLWCLRSADWYRRHWQRTGIVDVTTADDLPGGWRYWLQWHRTLCPDNTAEIAAVEADAGRTLAYVRAVGRRSESKLETYCSPDPLRSMPIAYEAKPLWRESQ